MSHTSPLVFVKDLADPLQPNRLKGLKSLNSWMDKFGPTYEFSTTEIDQLWRALYLCLWMADKRPIQQQVAAEIVLLIRRVKSSLVIEWNRGFWFNMERMYSTLDRYRVPKFHLLIRIYCSELFHQMQDRDWDSEFMNACFDAMLSNPWVSLGAFVQFVSIFTSELFGTIPEKDLNLVLSKPEAFKTLLRPIIFFLNSSLDQDNSIGFLAAEKVLTDERLLNHSNRKWIRSEIQKVAMASTTNQSARERLYQCIEVIDQSPVLPEKPMKDESKNKKKKDATVSVNTPKKKKIRT
jgi:hypothetical protein